MSIKPGRRVMKSPIKTVSLPEDVYNELKRQADNANRTLSGQVKTLLEDNNDQTQSTSQE